MPARKLTALVAMLALMVVFAHRTVARASCTCQCVNGHMQPLCDNSIDLPPIMPPDNLSDCAALYTSNFTADVAAFGNNVLSASASLRPLRELSLATRVPIKEFRKDCQMQSTVRIWLT